MCGLMSFIDFRKCLLSISSITTSVPYYSHFWSPVAYMVNFFIMLCISLMEIYVFSVFYLYRLLYGYFPLMCSIFQFINYISCMPSYINSIEFFLSIILFVICYFIDRFQFCNETYNIPIYFLEDINLRYY